MNTGFNAMTVESDEWETPEWLYKALDSEFGFTLDPCATSATAKCAIYYTKATDGLLQDWTGQRAFINPPYSNIEPFVRKASTAELTVLLLPVRTGSNWFRYLIENNAELRFFRKRIAFLSDGKIKKGPRFDSLVAIVK